MLKLLLKIVQIPHKLYYFNLRPKYHFLKNSGKNNSAPELEFIQKLSRYKIRWQPSNKNLVLTQIVIDHVLAIKLAAASNFIATKTSANIGLYSVHTKLDDTVYTGPGFWRTWGTESYYRPLSNLFLSFGGKIVHRNVFDHQDQSKVKKYFSAIKKQINSKEDVLKIKFDDISVGDLIYDTFLRSGNRCTMDIASPFLDRIIIEALNIYLNALELFSKYNVQALVNSYGTYIHHGIIVRLALKNKVPVYTVGSENSLVHKVSDKFPIHHNNHFAFRKIFNGLEKKEELVAQTKAVFEQRFEGKIDDATFYMKESAFSDYQNPELDGLDWNHTVVVLAHCFFDAPHSYVNFIYPDFYEWMLNTLDRLSAQKGLTVLVKQHPNGVKENDAIFDELRIRYPHSNIRFIDKKTSQLQLIRSKPRALITGYGTAATELAYKGIPVVTVFDNPFTSFDFSYLANTVAEYEHLLDNILSLQPKDENRQILEYYYMQHVFFFKGYPPDFLNVYKFRNKSHTDDFLKQHMPSMNDAYFEKLDRIIADGFELADWESRQI